MTVRAIARFGAATVTTVGLLAGVAACAVADDAAPTIPADPTEAVTAAFERLDGEPFTVDVVMGELMTGTAVIDPTADASRVTLGLSEVEPGRGLGIETISIGSDVWVRMTGDLVDSRPGTEGWMHTTRGSASLEALNEFDLPEVIAAMRDSFSDVTETGPGSYELTFGVDVFGDAFGDGTLDGLRATIDLSADGRIASITTHIPNAVHGEDQTLVLTFDAFGEPAAIEPPPAHEVRELGDVTGG